MPYVLLDCDNPIPERMKHTYVFDPEEKIIPACNINTVPGDMTERGCAFAGARGVVGGPVKDVIHMVHGPVGCAFYTWGTRRNLSDNELHRRYCWTTDLQESDIVYGGEKTLEKAYYFNPLTIGIHEGLKIDSKNELKKYKTNEDFLKAVNA